MSIHRNVAFEINTLITTVYLNVLFIILLVTCRAPFFSVPIFLGRWFDIMCASSLADSKHCHLEYIHSPVDTALASQSSERKTRIPHWLHFVSRVLPLLDTTEMWSFAIFPQIVAFKFGGSDVRLSSRSFKAVSRNWVLARGICVIWNVLSARSNRLTKLSLYIVHHFIESWS